MNNALNIALLVAACSRIEGRKKLQKIVYLLQQMGHEADFPHEFGYLHYGPYSRHLRSEIDYLSAKGEDALLDEKEEDHGSHRTYTYEPSAVFLDLAKELDLPQDPPWAATARELAIRDAQDLEAISTVVYLRNMGVAESDLASRFAALKPGLAGRFALAHKEASKLVPVTTVH